MRLGGVGGKVNHQFGDGMDYGLQGQEVGCPAMEEKVCCVRPLYLRKLDHLDLSSPVSVRIHGIGIRVSVRALYTLDLKPRAPKYVL